MDILLWAAGGGFVGCLAALYVFTWLAAGGTTAEMLAKAANRIKAKMAERTWKAK